MWLIQLQTNPCLISIVSNQRSDCKHKVRARLKSWSWIFGTLTSISLQFQRLIPLLFNFPSTAKSLQTVQVWQLCRNKDECNPQKSLPCEYFFLLQNIQLGHWFLNSSFSLNFCINILRDSIDFTFYRLLIFQATLISPISTALRDKWLELLATYTVSRSDGIQIEILFCSRTRSRHGSSTSTRSNCATAGPTWSSPRRRRTWTTSGCGSSTSTTTHNLLRWWMMERQIIRLWRKKKI